MLLNELKENLNNYNFKQVNEKIKNIVIDKDTYNNFGEIIEILKSDKRKNILALATRLEKKILNFKHIYL